MTWHRTDDGFPEHPKSDALSAHFGDDWAACAVAFMSWHHLGCDCAARRTDGVFNAARAYRVVRAPREVIDRALAGLVKVGLLDKHREGFVFHDWAEYQPTRAELDADRAAKTERQKRWRESRAGNRGAVDGAVDASTSRLVDGAVDAAPSRPVPSRPDPSQRESLARSPAREDADTILSVLSRASKGAVSSVATLPQQVTLATMLGDLGVVGVAEVERFGASLAEGGMKRGASWLKTSTVTAGQLVARDGSLLADLVAAWKGPTAAAGAPAKRKPTVEEFEALRRRAGGVS